MSVKKNKGNLSLEIKSPFIKELKDGQSIAHNGTCLTVTGIKKNSYAVTVVKESLERTNLGLLKKGDLINLERCMKIGDRLDGHIVQGHVDCTGVCKEISKQNGSTKFTFAYRSSQKKYIVEKGSICVNGVSLTVVDAGNNIFSVAVIPYTLQHTNFHKITTGDTVNLEFDIIGKYVERILKR